MKLKDEQSWNEWVAANDDPYGKACITVARRVMEILDDGKPFDCHKIICQADDETKAGGITGFMAGAVAQMVSTCHERGEEFRVQWNSGYRTKGEDTGGVVNPAILNIEIN